jgi:hypothetical protein
MTDPLPPQEPERQNADRKPDGESGNSGEQAGQTEVAITRPPPNVPPPPPNPTSPYSKGKNAHRGKANWVEIGMFILEFFGVIGLAYYCVINHRELKVFDKERGTMESEFRLAQSNAVIDQNTAKDQLREMQEARKLDERAWVCPYYSDNNLFQETSSNIALRIQIKNTGKTPAIVYGEWFGQVGDPNLIPQTDPTPIHSSVLLSPNVVLNLTADSISPVGMAFIKNNIPWYIYGTVYYSDIFGDQHWTQICITLSGYSEGPGPGHNACGDVESDKTK